LLTWCEQDAQYAEDMHSVLQRELVKARLHNRVVRAHGVASPYPGLVPSVLGPLATVSTPSAEEDEQVLSLLCCEFLSFGWFVGSEKSLSFVS
jgi:hypothetical protein